jgi:medium-chain acyl-[acyl-carrier-protein] hydrolase
MYYSWPDDLPLGVELCAVKLPGREGRLAEPPFSRLGPLIRALADVLRPALGEPFAFFGHSVGALISFELARELRRQHAPTPLHLLVSARAAPQVPNLDPPIHGYPDPSFIRELRRFNGMPDEVLQNDELMELLLPVLRADFAVNETYRYTAEPPLSCPISVFGGLQDHEVRLEGLAAWREQTDGAFSQQMFPGDHFYIYPAREQLLRAVSDQLAGTLRVAESLR